MMISPECYYEEHLKGRSVKEIEDRIQELRDQIKRLVMTLEAPDYGHDLITFPSEDVQLHMSRLYLEKAKEALLEAGGSYLPSEEELKSEAFNDRLAFLNRIELTIKVFAVSHEKWTVTFSEDGGKLSLIRYPIYGIGDPEVEEGGDVSKAYFLQSLADLRLGEWPSNYEPADHGHAVLDGISWDLELSFSDGGESVKYTGSNAYPYNFDKLKFLMGMDEDEYKG